MAFNNFQSSGGTAFGGGFQNSAGSNSQAQAQNGQVQAQNGPNLEDIQTEALGFHAISGDAKIQLLSTPWPSDSLPKPSSSLLSIASRRGLLAAAGPDQIIVAYTENVRKAYQAPGGNGNIKPFEPQLRLPMPMRISQLAFSADEEYLILCAENGGGLAIYEVQSLLNGGTDFAFQISTNQEAVRALVPNPAPEKGELIAVVTDQGKLMLANLKQKELISGANGPVLKDKVSCVSWSKLGKQLVAGLADGTAYQLTPEGKGTAEIPRPPSLSGDYHVSQILWLETTVFLTVHMPTSFDNNRAPSAEFHIVTKEAPKVPNYVFQKVSEPAGPFGLNRSPPHHFILRLKEFPPNLQDTLIVASSASTDIGLLTRSATPLESTNPITNVFTFTEPADDARRAALPLGTNDSDMSPIGIALDLSAKEPVMRPIPLDDEINQSDGPLPGVMVLTNEGVLASWWLVYSDSIRQKTTYPGLVSQQTAQQAAPQAPTQQQPAFGSQPTQSSFGAASTFGGAASAFGAGSGFGPKASPWATTPTSNSTVAAAKPAAPAFGTSAFSTPSLPSALAAPAKPFQSPGAAPAFGQTATFGSSAVPGQKASLWGSPSTATSSTTPAMGSIPASGGFASFVNKGGFAAAAASASSGQKLFETKPNSGLSSFSGSNSFREPEEPTKSVFGGNADMTVDTPTTEDKSFFKQGSFFGNTNNSTPEANKSDQTNPSPFTQDKPGGLFGTGPVSSLQNSQEKPNPFAKEQSGGFSSTPFKLESSFKPDGSAKDDLPRPTSTGGSNFFGSGFGDALNTSQTPAASDETGRSSNEATTTPSATPVAPKFDFGTGPKAAEGSGSGSFFGTTPSKPAESLFGANPAPTTSTPQVSIFGKQDPLKPAAATGNLFGSTKDSPAKATGNLFGSAKKDLPETSTPSKSIFGGSNPLEVPEDNSKLGGSFFGKSQSPSPVTATPAFNSGDTKPTNSTESDAPLPPDFSTQPKSAAADAPLPPDFSTLPKSAAADAPLPPDFSTQPKSAATDIPIPPVPKPAVKNEKQEEIPAVPLADDSDSTDHETYSVPTEDDEGDDNDGDFSEEGSGEDVTKDLSPVSDSNNTVGLTPQSSFGGAVNKGASSLFGKSAQGSSSVNKGPSNLFGNSAQGSSSRPLFGEVHFPPPARPGSPRSPSPMRSAVPSRLRPESLRSVSTPPFAHGGTGNSQAQSPQLHQSMSTSFSMDQKIAEDERKAKAKAEKEAKEAEEAQAMIDDDDNLALKQLNAEIAPTKILDEFIAHQDYLGSADRTGIPAQVETVYKDINSMVDTLGMNAKALKAFILGHSEGQKADGRTREDLENDSGDWLLGEIEDLTSIIERDLAKELEQNRIPDKNSKLEKGKILESEAMRSKQKLEDIKELVAQKTDFEQRELVLAAPLSKDQACQQAEVRKRFKEFQDKLIESEESLTVLKAKLVSRGGRASANGGAVPTIDAVIKTISKMMAMAEKKSGDVDVLETELRTLNLGANVSPGSREGSPLAASIRSSPLGQSTLRASTATRTPLRSSMANGHNSFRFSGRYETPDSFHSTSSPSRNLGMSVSMLSRSRGSLASSMRSSTFGSPAKLTMDQVPDEAMLRVNAKMARKRAVAEQLRLAMARVAPRIVGMDDE